MSWTSDDGATSGAFLVSSGASNTSGSWSTRCGSGFVSTAPTSTSGTGIGGAFVCPVVSCSS